MRIVLLPLAVLAVAVFTGCAGPENKLGRGLSNATEFARLGEIRRSMEQTAAWDGANQAATTGFIRGFNRSVARTGVGLYEVATFPFPPYGPSFAKGKVYPDPSIATRSYPWGGLTLTENPAYPANYRPGVGTDSMYEADKRLGFSSGDAFPFVPGSSFKTLSP
jgi:putative exosortase-associated protein (TIGR04073 family)